MIIPVTNPLGPAFPTHEGTENPGLTVREYFAAVALQGLLANGNMRTDVVYAALAVRIADELIAELNKEPPR